MLGDGCAQAPRGVAGVLRQLTTLHALRRLEADMGWLLCEGLLPLEAARAIPGQIRCALLCALQSFQSCCAFFS